MVHRAIACFLARKAEPASGLISQEPVTSTPGVTHEASFEDLRKGRGGESGKGIKREGDFDCRGFRVCKIAPVRSRFYEARGRLDSLSLDRAAAGSLPGERILPSI